MAMLRNHLVRDHVAVGIAPSHADDVAIHLDGAPLRPERVQNPPRLKRQQT
jgi:hypothetical protein